MSEIDMGFLRASIGSASIRIARAHLVTFLLVTRSSDFYEIGSIKPKLDVERLRKSVDELMKVVEP